MIFIRRCPNEKIALFDAEGRYQEVTLVSLNEDTGHVHLSINGGTPVPLERGGSYQLPNIETEIRLTRLHFFDRWPTAAGLQITAAPGIVVQREELVQGLDPEQLVQVARDRLRQIEAKREQKRVAQLSGNV